MSEEELGTTRVEVDYDIPRGEYASFITRLRSTLAKHKGNKPPIPDVVDGHPVLETQTGTRKPERWIDCKLMAVGERQQPTEATLALRGDNVYLIGFRARSQQWYEFGFQGRSVRLVDPGSIFLECDVDYRDLLGVPTGNPVKPALMALQLGKSLAEQGVNGLSGYAQAAGGKADAATKMALARMAVMFCESARMNPIYDTVSNGWAGHGNLTDRQVDYLWRWGDMSQAILGWSLYNWVPKPLADKLRRIDVRNKAEALRVVNLILNKKPQPKPKPKLVEEEEEEEDEALALGHALLEVFSVRADFPVVGIVAVFDGMRGQIIYHRTNNPSPTTKQGGELVLTGPYRAVSAADGNCAVRVLDTDYAAGGKSGDAAGGTLDCHSDAVHDAPMTRAISTPLGPVEVTYAVLSNAVQATVQVRLLAHAAGTHVYGKVAARSGALHGVASVLFSRDAGDKVATDDDCTVPLARTVVAAPLGSPFVVVATFHTSENNDVVHGELEFEPDLSGEHVKLVHGDEQGHGAVEVKVTWWSEI